MYRKRSRQPSLISREVQVNLKGQLFHSGIKIMLSLLYKWAGRLINILAKKRAVQSAKWSATLKRSPNRPRNDAQPWNDLHLFSRRPRNDLQLILGMEWYSVTELLQVCSSVYVTFLNRILHFTTPYHHTTSYYVNSGHYFTSYIFR